MRTTMARWKNAARARTDARVPRDVRREVGSKRARFCALARLYNKLRRPSVRRDAEDRTEGRGVVKMKGLTDERAAERL